MVLFLTSCGSEYKKQVNEYETLFDETMLLLDSENVYESIKENDITTNFEKLNVLLKKIRENIPQNRINDFLILKAKHDRLEEIIENGLKWDSLGESDKRSIKNAINRLKPKQ